MRDKWTHRFQALAESGDDDAVQVAFEELAHVGGVKVLDRVVDHLREGEGEVGSRLRIRATQFLKGPETGIVPLPTRP